MNEHAANSRARELARKDRMRRANLLLGWVTFAAVVTASLSEFGWASPAVGNTGKAVFFISIFSHAFAVVYCYGIPNWEKSPRVIDFYVGAAIFLFVLANATFRNVTLVAALSWWLMWLPIVVHITLGAWFAAQRLTRNPVTPPFTFYLGGPLQRDALKGRASGATQPTQRHP